MANIFTSLRILPLLIGRSYAWQAKALVVILACVVASIAAVQECVCILRGGHAA